MRIFRLNQDEILIDRIRENDRTVLTELYLKYERLVTDQIIRLGGDHDAAEDMLQEAIIILWEKVRTDRFRLEAKLSTFIASVARNTFMNELRKKKKSSNPIEGHEYPVNDVSVLDEIIDAERTELVARAMQELQEICRKILMLFYYERCSLARIAEELHFANEQVAKSKKYQCKNALKEILIRKKILPEEQR